MSGAGYFRLGGRKAPRNRRRKRLPLDRNIVQERLNGVCSALDALYPARYRGNHRLHPLEVCNQVVRTARQVGLRLGWKKFFRYLCRYQADTMAWSRADWVLSKGLQKAVLRGRNFARSRLNCENFARNACRHMLANCGVIPYRQLPRQLRHYQCLGGFPRPVKELIQQVHRHRRPGKFPVPQQVLRWSTFGTTTEIGRFRVIRTRGSATAKRSYLDYTYDTDKSIRRVTTRDLLGLKRRKKRPDSMVGNNWKIPKASTKKSRKKADVHFRQMSDSDSSLHSFLYQEEFLWN